LQIKINDKKIEEQQKATAKTDEKLGEMPIKMQKFQDS